MATPSLTGLGHRGAVAVPLCPNHCNAPLLGGLVPFIPLDTPSSSELASRGRHGVQQTLLVSETGCRALPAREEKPR